MEQKTYLVIAQYRTGSDYQDEIGYIYHFPQKYFNLLTSQNAEFIYFEPPRRGKGEYFGYGKITRVYEDPNDNTQFFAELDNYHPFRTPVSAVDEQGHTRE